MIFIYCTVGLALVYIVYMNLINPIIIYAKIKDNFGLLKEKYNFSFWSSDNKNYDYVIKTENSKLLIRVLVIPSNSAITVNSRNTWALSWGGRTKNKGRQKKNKKILDNMTGFLNMKVKKEEIKIIYLYKTTEKIQKHLNESDIDIFEFGDWCYDYKITSHKTLIKDFLKLKEN
ncbi:MAG TPA: hypothetical protein GX695_01375 [Acholeplasmataceae bacterium]|nr:hypothetical protein [Acholeplasmataceae bacterium]